MSAFPAEKRNNLLIAKHNDKEISLPILMQSITGSRLYGTQYEKGENPLDPDYVSDYDFRGIFIMPEQNHLSIFNESDLDTAQVINDDDEEYYELKKFILMAIDNNPNIMDILFADEQSMIFETNLIKPLFDHRHAFLSLRAKDSFSGYAKSQLSRLKNHRKFLVNFPDIYKVENALKSAFENKDIDFQWIADHFDGKLAKLITSETAQNHQHFTNINYTEFKQRYVDIISDNIPLSDYRKPSVLNFIKPLDSNLKPINLDETLGDKIESYATYQPIKGTGLIAISDGGSGLINRDGSIKKPGKNKDGNFIAYATVDEAGYKKAIKQINNLWDWRNGRNEKRAILEREYGYDTKHAMHLCRLLIGAKNLFLNGTYEPRLKGDDLEFIKSIREGKLSYEEVIEFATQTDDEVKAIAESGNHNINEKPDLELINEIMLNIYSRSETMSQRR